MELKNEQQDSTQIGIGVERLDGAFGAFWLACLLAGEGAVGGAEGVLGVKRANGLGYPPLAEMMLSRVIGSQYGVGTSISGQSWP